MPFLRGITAHDFRLARRRCADSIWVSAALLIAAACSVYLVFWPGLVDWDTSKILAEARSGPIIDWWTGLGTLMLRDWLSLRLSIGVLWAACVAANVLGLYGCLRPVMARTPAAAATLMITVFPPVYGQLASFSRDNACMGFTLLTFAALAHMAGTAGETRRNWLSTALLCAVMAAICRQNGVVDIAAVVVFASVDGRGLNWRRTALVAAGALAAAVTLYASLGVAQMLSGVQSTHASRATLVYDLAAMSVRTGDDLFPRRQLAALGPGTASPADTSLAWLRRHFDAWDENTLSGVVNMRVTDTRLDAREDGLLERAWLHAVVDHPLAYLGVRARLAGLTLGLGRASTEYDPELLDYTGLASATNYGHPLRFRSAYAVVNRVLELFVGRAPALPLDSGWIYLLLLAISCVAIRRSRARLGGFAGALVSAVLLNQAVLFFTAPSACFRYVLILAPASLIAVVLARRTARENAVQTARFPRPTRSRPAFAKIKPGGAVADRNGALLLRKLHVHDPN